MAQGAPRQETKVEILLTRHPTDPGQSWWCDGTQSSEAGDLGWFPKIPLPLETGLKTRGLRSLVEEGGEEKEEEEVSPWTL
ncbi:hypothetical protein BTVI_67317 [Pitangus sulphuratus]|nr:hypothetical protein BTVI_67317 [Pitangus sulphuratus]